MGTEKSYICTKLSLSHTLMLMKFSPNCLLKALASKVLPVPGAPNSRTPEVCFSLKLEYTLGNYRKTLLSRDIINNTSTKS